MQPLCYRITIPVLAILTTISSQDSGFYEYGSGTSDETLANGNDISSAPISISTPLYFYGEAYSTLYVNTNGVISLNDPIRNPMTAGQLNEFPLYQKWDGDPEVNVLIAPFWADVDASAGRGDVYYRESTDSSLLDRVSSDVQALFLQQTDYSAVWVFVATWVDVSFFDHNTESGNDPTNTFQAVITTDGLNSFAFYRYQRVEWTAGTTINGDPDTGIPPREGEQAVVGFNKGDGYDGTMVALSDMTDLPTSSNIDIPGLYAFQIDDEVKAAGCDPLEASVTTIPVYGNMFGGEKVYLSGPCWSPSDADSIKCRFMMGETELQVANGTVVDRQTAYCVPEPFFMVGEVDIHVSLNGGQTWAHDGVYSIVYPGRVTGLEGVTKESGDWSMADNPLTITWNIDQYEEGSPLDIHTLAYREDGDAGPRFEVVGVIGVGVDNTGTYTFTPEAVEAVTEDNAFGLVRVQPTNGGVGSKLYSAVTALGYILEQEYQDDPVAWSNEKCGEWGALDDSLADYSETLLSCPCTLDQALSDSGRFQPDTGCSMFAGSVCTYHVGAKHCVRSVFGSEDHAGTQCCYDHDGFLMYAGDSDQGSTNDRSHVWGSEPYLAEDMVPSLSHWKHDVITFYYCCIWGTDCRTYMERRITMDCAEYEPPQHAVTFGDPHFITFDNANYTFNGKGEFTMIEADAASGFRLDGRFEFIPADSSGTSQQDGTTGLTAVVMFDDFSDVVTVEKNHISGLALYRGEKGSDRASNIEVDEWERVDFTDHTWLDLPGFSVTINDEDEDGELSSLTLMFKSSEMGVNVTRGADQDLLAVTLIVPPELEDSTSLEGLLGNYNNDPYDDLEERNGDTLDPGTATDEEIYQYGLSWLTPETKLFRYTSDKSHEQLRNATAYNPVFVSPDESSLTSSELSFMDDTCGDVYQCRFDFLVTRVDSFAYDAASVVEHYEWAREMMVKIVSCPYFYTPLNGTKEYWQEEDGDIVSTDKNNFVGTTVRVECGEGHILVGSPERICQEDGTYSGSETENDCIASTCGSLPVVENGYMSLSEFDNKQVVTVTCDDGYSLEGANRHECDWDTWTGATSSCTSKSDGGKIAGIVIGSLIGGALFIALCVFCVMQGKKQAGKPKNKPKTARPVYYDPEDPTGPKSITQISMNTAPKSDHGTAADEKMSTIAPSVRSSAGTMHNGYPDEDGDDLGSMTSHYQEVGGGGYGTGNDDLSSLASSAVYKGYDEVGRDFPSGHLDI